VQRVVKVRRDYNDWVARETMEDYALRFTPHSFRKWSELRVANTAFGARVVPGARGGRRDAAGRVRLRQRVLAILATGLIIFLAGLADQHLRGAPRRRHGPADARRRLRLHRLDRHLADLRVVHVHLFALEAAIKAYALELAFDVPPALGY
jgi:hypothetical protein